MGPLMPSAQEMDRTYSTAAGAHMGQHNEDRQIDRQEDEHKQNSEHTHEKEND